MNSIQRLTVRVVAMLLGSTIVGAGVATNPATAQGFNSLVRTFGTTLCSKSTFCMEYKNRGSGTAVVGIAGNGIGIVAESTNGAGTFSKSTNAPGVQAYSTNNDGINAGTTNASTLHSARSGVWGHDDSTDGGQLNVGVSGSSTSGIGVSGTSTYDVGVEAVAGFNGYGIIAHGGAVGIDASTDAGIGNSPLLLTDQNGTNLLLVNGNGDLFVHGTYNNFARIRNGDTVVSYGITSASPSIEDTGSGQLVDGVAMIRLDTTFAQAIDPRQSYHVMLTPDGDTRGLFVAAKSPNGFVVREVQGGRGSVSFDYHIYAAALGHANQRMLMMTPAQTASFMPHAKPFARRP